MADPPESLLKWAAFPLGEEATVVSVTGPGWGIKMVL
jgi:hypothetical protein